MRAIVLHNVSTDMFFEYKPETSKLYHAHTFELEESSSYLEDVWGIANQYPEDVEDEPFYQHYLPQIHAYRQRSNRSLSMSDVVILVDGEAVVGAWTAVTVGWREIDMPTGVDLSDVDNHQEASIAWAAHAKFLNRAMEED